MPVKQLQEYLDAHNMTYQAIEHSPAYTAKEIADLVDVKSEQVAKTVMVIMDGVLSMIVLPASCRIRMDRFARVMGTELIDLASEEEFKNRFPECDVGAMPPFGRMYEIPVYMYEGFNEGGAIVFRGGRHDEVIKMDFKDYKMLAQPMTLSEGFARIGVSKPDWMMRRKAG
ncbi:hypothetical protein A3715_15120 [Oleiphilus sp. HI0009]|jgi:Ala-tRNA(Pro) deacylase|uniref:aminoacyl-tRNA deacylase n=1 Tax=unclassified Oleiphilus TaxID=2631174 RepID=UPI0007C24202|nr:MULTISPECIES: YbaK/EbsC family protein [unclassified Oleiphilus]KZX74843.1 hypothetical protein A3715_15120 [Oleiphilus sp. HI0009]MCH2158185.1 YbaK/EbsC family protein [Oleiphilaceae bacterium]KZY62686.1 hypothetical protein A3738_12590 [Oleiphilus sp. HI0066]KZY67395.1 hypothetical protein A3739_21910 [Oleiphilus sp. HI0067]KZY70867.1 hypothetical protein A3739_05715 [Oleiphilus sp. HI0067]